MMTIKKVLVFILLTSLMIPMMAVGVLGEKSEEKLVYYIDGENVTRWADTSVVYRNRKTTKQNEYGHNVVVDKDGKVTKIIKGGDIAGKDLAIPEGGMVVSATGYKVDWLIENISVDDYVYYDSISSRVLVSKTGDFSPFYEVNHKITGFNKPRYSLTFIIYNNSNTKTETNGFGYEVLVNSEGTIISAGGNDNTVPENGFVISAIESPDIEFLKMYANVGASAVISNDNSNVTITYNAENLKKSIQIELEGLKTKIEKAKESYLLVDYEKIEAKIKQFENVENIDSLSLRERDRLFSDIDDALFSISETPAVEMRAIWHTPVEKTVEDVKKVVSDLKASGINQLNIGISSGYGAIFPLPEDFPFRQKASLRKVDILKAYIDECKNAGIEIVACVSIFRNDAGETTKNTKWLTNSNGEKSVEDESKEFFSPASKDYREYLKKYLRYLIENYELDGLQLDYIRYPGAISGIDYGYDDNTKSLFAEKYNVDASVVDEIGTQLTNHSMWNQWVEFKTDLISSFVKEIRELTNEVRPDLFLTAAVASDIYFNMYCQDSKKWISEGWVDAIYPMTYGEGVVSGRIDEFASYTGEDSYLFMGVGSYMPLSNAEVYRQVMDSRYKADGVAFFEYFSYLSHGYSDFLQKNAFNVLSLSPTLDSTKAANAQIDYAVKRINEVVVPFNGISDDKAKQIVDSLEALKNDITLEKTDSAIEEINKVISGEDGETAIKADLKKLRKIVMLSKDNEKAAYPGVNKDDGNTESETNSLDESNNDGKTKATWIWLIAIVVVLIAAGVILITKKKK